MNNQDSQIQIFSEVQLSYTTKQPSNFETIKSSQTVAKIMRSILPKEQINYREYMYALYLNNSNKIVGYQLMSIGGLTATVVDIRILLQGALLTSSTAIILCHNHPSGTLKPSQADNQITQKVKKASEFMDIKLLDHLILTEKSYFSFADEGVL